MSARHESFYRANILYCNISIRNILLKEDKSDGFLIDLNFAIDISRLKTSGALGKTGTRVFIAIDAFCSDLYMFMHNLESFF